jgi:aspartate racemase
MSWESTISYYRQVNEVVKERLGGFHSAKIVLYSVDFHEVERFQREGNWRAAGEMLARAARSLESAGAELLVLCTNTMHKVSPAIESAVRIPLLHIVDPTGAAIKEAKISTVGILGTKFTMEDDFYRRRLTDRYGLHILIPEQNDRDVVHRVIFEELVLGKVLASSRAVYRRIIAELVKNGAGGIILGCTEISMLIAQSDSAVPLFDTASIHARKAAALALGISETGPLADERLALYAAERPARIKN